MVKKLDTGKFEKQIFSFGGLNCGKTQEDLRDIGQDAKKLLLTDRKSPDSVRLWCQEQVQG